MIRMAYEVLRDRIVRTPRPDRRSAIGRTGL